MERKRSARRHRRYDKPFAKKCKEYIRNFLAFMFSNVGIIGLVVGYTTAGAFIFQAIESASHQNITNAVLTERRAMAKLIWNLTVTYNIFPEGNLNISIAKEIDRYQENFVRYVRRGYDGAESLKAEQWSLAGSFLYSLTVITTIGYGNIFPRTLEGKLTTIAYAIIGMPLFLLYLSNIGDVMARSFKWIYANVCLCRWCPGVAKRRAERRRRRELHMEYYSDGTSDTSGESFHSNIPNGISPAVSEDGTTDLDSAASYDVQTVTVPVTICLAIMVGYICGGALLFSRWEDWEFLDGSYFCFISLSTIGFGDIVPGDKIYTGKVFDLSFIFCAMYLMLGMALIAMCFNLMQEEVIHKIRTTIDTVKYMFRCRR